MTRAVTSTLVVREVAELIALSLGAASPVATRLTWCLRELCCAPGRLERLCIFVPHRPQPPEQQGHLGRRDRTADSPGQAGVNDLRLPER